MQVTPQGPGLKAAPSKAAFRGLKAPAPSAQKRCKLNKTKTNLRTFVSFLAGRRSPWTTVTKRHGGRFSAACKARLILSHLCTGEPVFSQLGGAPTKEVHMYFSVVCI